MGIEDFLFGKKETFTPAPPSQWGEADWEVYRPGSILYAHDPSYYEKVKQFDPQYIASQQTPVAAIPASAPSAAAPYAGPGALQQFNDALGAGFESRYQPDTVDDPFVSGALTSGRNKADEFIATMLRRGTLTETGRTGAVSALDKQTPNIQTKLQNIGTGLLSRDRANLTNLADSLRGGLGGASGEGFDPSPLVNQIASLGQSQSSTFGDRFNQDLPPGDLFDTSGVAGASGAVTGPKNVSFDPYAVEGGKLSTGLDEGGAPPPSKKRSTSVF